MRGFTKGCCARYRFVHSYAIPRNGVAEHSRCAGKSGADIREKKREMVNNESFQKICAM